MGVGLNCTGDSRLESVVSPKWALVSFRSVAGGRTCSKQAELMGGREDNIGVGNLPLTVLSLAQEKRTLW